MVGGVVLNLNADADYFYFVDFVRSIIIIPL